MTMRNSVRPVLCLLVCVALSAPLAAQKAAAAGAASSAATPAAKAPEKPDAKQAAPKSGDPAALFPTKSKDPIYITADRLDIYDKEGRAVYSGASGVVVTQGPSKVVGTELVAYYERQHDKDGGGDKQQAAAGSSSPMTGSAVKRIVVKGPVSVVQNDQVATGDNAEFDRVQNIVTIVGHVSLTQGPNVTTGDKLIYNLNTGVANVYSAPGTPVKSLFVQGSQNGAGEAKGSPAPDKPAPAKPQKPSPGKTAKQQ